jgi:UDP-4-amino-4,6-dideoxy-N-acetyl-beta-L-altrosamine N-acetyltransferase
MKLEIKNFRKLNLSQQSSIRFLRNNSFIRKQMINSKIINDSEHKKWIDYIKNKKDTIIFVLFDQYKKVFGTVTISDIKDIKKSCYWSFFLKNNKMIGLGPSIEHTIINFIFYKMKLNTLYCNVLCKNTSVLSLHEKFGFEKIKTQKKSDKKVFKEIFLLKTTKKKWDKNKDFISKKYEKVFKKYEFQFN